MKKAQLDAMERQQYTPKLIAGTCGNCTHFKFDMALPAWMQKQPGVWGDEHKLQQNFRCGFPGAGEFPVKKLGSCCEHAFVDDSAGS